MQYSTISVLSCGIVISVSIHSRSSPLWTVRPTSRTLSTICSISLVRSSILALPAPSSGSEKFSVTQLFRATRTIAARRQLVNDFERYADGHRTGATIRDTLDLRGRQLRRRAGSSSPAGPDALTGLTGPGDCWLFAGGRWGRRGGRVLQST